MHICTRVTTLYALHAAMCRGAPGPPMADICLKIGVLSFHDQARVQLVALLRCQFVRCAIAVWGVLD